MRIIVGSIMHESNTFSNEKTNLVSFEKAELLFGEQIITHHTNKRTEMGGILQVLKSKGVEILPTVSAAACPCGVITRETFEFLKAKLIMDIVKAKNIDGILLVLHGASVVEKLDDPEGNLLQEVREIVRKNVFIGVTLDMHANVSHSMVRNADFLIGYRTHPHTDQSKTGQRAADIMLSLIEERIPTTMIMKKLPMILPAVNFEGPRDKLIEKIDELENTEGIICASFFIGYPYADVPISGASVLVVAKNNLELARKGANELASLFWKLRNELPVSPVPVDNAIREALNIEGGPVVFMDAGETLFGGAPGDVNTLLSAMIARKIENVALAAIIDPESVQRAIEIGQGKEAILEIGGKLDRVHSKPLKLKGKLKVITDKQIPAEDSVLSGYDIYASDMGTLVVFETNNNVEVVLAEGVGKVHEPAFLRNLGIQPEEKKIIIIKESILPQITYKDIAKKAILVDSPGWCSQNLRSLKYNRIPRPIFPLDPVEYHVP